MGIIKIRLLLPVVTSVTSNFESSNSTATHHIQLIITQSILNIVRGFEQLLYSKIETPSSLLRPSLLILEVVEDFTVEMVLECKADIFFVGIQYEEEFTESA